MEDGGAFMPPASKRPHHSHTQSGLLFPLTHHLIPGIPADYQTASSYTHSSSSSTLHRDDDARHRLTGSTTADEEWKNIHVVIIKKNVLLFNFFLILFVSLSKIFLEISN